MGVMSQYICYLMYENVINFSVLYVGCSGKNNTIIA